MFRYWSEKSLYDHRSAVMSIWFTHKMVYLTFLNVSSLYDRSAIIDNILFELVEVTHVGIKGINGDDIFHQFLGVQFEEFWIFKLRFEALASSY